MAGDGAEDLAVDTDASSELLLERDFDAPRELVWRAWTDPHHFAQWYAPHGATMPVCEIDARSGGSIRFCHQSADGMTVWVQGRFNEVTAPERLVMAFWFVDASGRPAAHPMFPDWPLEAKLVTRVGFRVLGRGTRLTVRGTITPPSAAALPVVVHHQRLAAQGWEEILERLTELLATAAGRSPEAGS